MVVNNITRGTFFRAFQCGVTEELNGMLMASGGSLIIDGTRTNKCE